MASAATTEHRAFFGRERQLQATVGRKISNGLTHLAMLQHDRLVIARVVTHRVVVQGCSAFTLSLPSRLP